MGPMSFLRGSRLITCLPQWAVKIILDASIVSVYSLFKERSVVGGHSLVHTIELILPTLDPFADVYSSVPHSFVLLVQLLL